MAGRPAIIPDMPIFGSDGGLVGIVDRVAGVRIVLARDGVLESDPHYIPLSWVASVTDRVTLDCPAANARPKSVTAQQEPGTRRLFGPATWAGVGVAAVVLLYLGSTLIPRAGAPVGAAAPSPVPTLSPSPSARAEGEGTSTRTPATRPDVTLASPQSIAEFLNSNDPPPQRFSLDSVAFPDGSATVSGDAAKAIDGIAVVMTTHLNTKIKLAAASDAGGLALRRVAAIRAALIGRGVADYRITTGAGRARSRNGAKSGVEMIVLAK